ncbi:choline dehydrogenase-like protein [Lindgomyces ingoldianus]|uniref:Choline dehydrogenase-like protein n=1 Tax=Lindgomyces ingoldianus TaxID=673940 RepID=A0ACB6QGU0_9PLEO|nr:choline dehydrogenase-like protein [Lindgomyces ingoldianus]KAF2466204.1 choline dehydrogenase-like protein [Lindgomyces ingoldianus]
MVAQLLILTVVAGLATVGHSLPSAARPAQIKRALADVSSTYDYIIIGGGTAGLTVANRLTEDAKKKVLVIENGELGDTIDLLLPNATSTLSQNSRYMWNFTSIPQTKLNGRTDKGYAGNVVGGSSSVNGMFMDRPSKADLDAWATLGNTGWDWAGLLPYFKKATKFTTPSAQSISSYGYTFDASYYGTGPVQASYPPFQWPFQKTCLEAWKDMDLPFIREGASGSKSGVLWVPNTLDPVSETRSYARTAYYDPIKTRSNYALLYNTNVQKLVFSDSGPLTAKGVFVKSKDGMTKTIYANKEVILSAGTFGSAWLLQRSGVGPKAVLNKAKIKVVLDFPGVGQNFQDQPNFFVFFALNNQPIPNPDYWRANATYNAETWQNYTQNHGGPYTLALGNNAAFMPISSVVDDVTALINAAKAQSPAQYLPSSYTPELIKGFSAQLSILLKHFAHDSSPAFETPFASGPFQAMSVQKPLSRGTVMLNTTDPFNSQPLIDYRTMTNPLDMDMAVAAFRYLIQYLSTPGMQSLGLVYQAPLPSNPANLTDAQIVDLMKSSLLASSFAHPTSTCSMLPQNMGGVVGPDLLVYGIKGLSVIDASIIPLLPSCHSTQLTYAIAEKGADLIKQRA